MSRPGSICVLAGIGETTQHSAGMALQLGMGGTQGSALGTSLPPLSSGTRPGAPGSMAEAGLRSRTQSPPGKVAYSFSSGVSSPMLHGGFTQTRVSQVTGRPLTMVPVVQAPAERGVRQRRERELLEVSGCCVDSAGQSRCE